MKYLLTIVALCCLSQAASAQNCQPLIVPVRVEVVPQITVTVKPVVTVKIEAAEIKYICPDDGKCIKQPTKPARMSPVDTRQYWRDRNRLTVSEITAALLRSSQLNSAR